LFCRAIAINRDPGPVCRLGMTADFSLPAEGMAIGKLSYFNPCFFDFRN